MMEDKQYTITLNKEQARLIAKALEMHSRMRCAQLGESYMPPIQDKIWKLKGSDLQEKRKIVDESLEKIKEALWPELEKGAHYGIKHDEIADLGYEMYKCILSQFEKEIEEECDRKGESYSCNVHTGTPLKLTDIPFIKIENNEKSRN